VHSYWNNVVSTNNQLEVSYRNHYPFHRGKSCEEDWLRVYLICRARVPSIRARSYLVM
jgi:hypothetical protein